MCELCDNFKKNQRPAEDKTLLEQMKPKEESPSVSSSGEVPGYIAGDINQGLNDDLKVLRVDGDPEGKGLPTVIVIENSKTGEVARFVREAI